MIQTNFEKKNTVSQEAETRTFKDLEEKRATLTNRVFNVLNLTKQDEKTKQYFLDKYERIVYDDTEQIEKIFHATDNFYEAADLYEKHAQEIAQKWGLDNEFRLSNNEKPVDNLEKFYKSLDCQKNISRANSLRINASGHEFDMLLALDGQQFLRDRGIKDTSDELKTVADVSSKMFSARFHGLLAKNEAHARIKGSDFKKAIIEVIKRIGSD